MILKVTWVLLLITFAKLRQSSLSPICEKNDDIDTSITREAYEHAKNVSEPTYEKEDIVSVLAAEFLFLIAGDHVFLPAPSDREEDIELHRNARIFANLLTKLNCTQSVYKTFNNTAQEVDVQSWNEPTDHQHLFSSIFQRVIEELENDSEVYAQFLREKDSLKNESIKLTEFHGELATSQKRTFYDIPSAEIPTLEQLLDNELVKKVVLTIELLILAEEPLAEVPESAKVYRRRLETVKGLFKLAVSEDVEIRRRIQKIFDVALNEGVQHYEMIGLFGNGYEDSLSDSLSKKIENDDLVRTEFYHLKKDLE